MPAEQIIRSRSCRRTFLSSAVLLLLLAAIVCSYERAAISFRSKQVAIAQVNQERPGDSEDTTPLERPSPDDDIALNDLVLVIKTGATESLRKLPVHFNTTLRHWPHVLLLSDFAEQLEGHTVHDTLDIVSESFRQESASFELWRRLREGGRNALDNSDPETGQQIQWLAASTSDRQAGWRLARFMNLPMAVKARQYRPDAKWFVFIDADTFVSRSNLVRLLRGLDYSKPMYLGSQVAMGPGEFFAHGGSGYVLSQAALANVVEYYQSEQELWDTLAEDGDFGEVPLARALLNLSIPLTWAFPHFQGGDPCVMDYAEFKHGRKIWCYPAITFHHVDGGGIVGLSDFEDSWTRDSARARAPRFSDIFKSWALPQILRNGGEDWDNASDDILEGVNSEAECRSACLENQRCLQYSFVDGECRTDEGHPKVGRARQAARSGWNMERIDRLIRALDRQCEESILV